MRTACQEKKKRLCNQNHFPHSKILEGSLLIQAMDSGGGEVSVKLSQSEKEELREA